MQEGLIDRRTGIFLGILFVRRWCWCRSATSSSPRASPATCPTYIVALLGKYLTYALLAVALDLVWGYAGILSLGHGAFFALGGYAMGMHLMREIGDRGVYANAELPDFMVFLSYKKLPWFWHGFDMFWFACLMVLFVPGAARLRLRLFAFRSRVTGVYLSIITQALTYALMLAFFRNEMGFGGNNGLTDFKDVLGFDLSSDTTRAALFVALRPRARARHPDRPRDHRARRPARCWSASATPRAATRFLGYRVEHYKLFVFVVSAMLAGLAGALYVPQVGIINPTEFSPANSIEIVIWVALGGRGTLDRRRARRADRRRRQELAAPPPSPTPGSTRSASCSSSSPSSCPRASSA